MAKVEVKVTVKLPKKKKNKFNKAYISGKQLNEILNTVIDRKY